MIWILIIALYSGLDGVAISSLEFNSLEACKSAAELITKDAESRRRGSMTLCTAKGKK